MNVLETHYSDLCDIEFTIERGKLWMLQTRVGKRTAAAAFRIAVQLVDEGVIDLDTALTRVTGAPARDADVPAVRPQGRRATLIAKGMAASPGAAVGKAAFDSATAIEWAAAGEDVILVRRETNPDDLGGMVAARGILTSRGGKTSHAAVVARGMGRTCVVGVEALRVDAAARRGHHRRRHAASPRATSSPSTATTGEVFLGAVPVIPSPVAQVLTGEDISNVKVDDDERDLLAAVQRIMDHADARRRMRRAGQRRHPRGRRPGPRAFGAAGHRPVPHRAHVPRLAADDRRAGHPRPDTAEARQAALDELLPLQREDFVGILEAMDGLPVVIRLLDPPLHEFLPDYTALSVQGGARRGQRAHPTPRRRPCCARCSGCTSRTRCSACAASGSGSSSPTCSSCRCRPSPRPPPGSSQGRQGPAARDHGPADRGGRGADRRPARQSRRPSPASRPGDRRRRSTSRSAR